jgi:hypothetical protein
MRDAGQTNQTSDSPRTYTLSTGHDVTLPLRSESSGFGAVFSFPRSTADELLPDGLKPIRATPRQAAVTIGFSRYHNVVGTDVKPYEEVGIIIPAVPDGNSTYPYISLLSHATSGYIWYLPVTTKPAKALGVDVWDYPKEVVEIDAMIDDECGRVCASKDGEEILSLQVSTPSTFQVSDTSPAYTTIDGTVRRADIAFDGQLGVRPFSTAVSISFGSHPKVVPLRSESVGGRALLRYGFEAETEFYDHEAMNQ